MSAVRTGKRAAQDSTFTFTGAGRGREIREAAEIAAAIHQPGLRVLLATLGRDDVQRDLVKIGALARVGGAR